MYKVLFKRYDSLDVCSYHAAVYLRSAPYTGDTIIKNKDVNGKCTCCALSSYQNEKALNTPKEEYMPFLLENV